MAQSDRPGRVSVTVTGERDSRESPATTGTPTPFTAPTPVTNGDPPVDLNRAKYTGPPFGMQ